MDARSAVGGAKFAPMVAAVGGALGLVDEPKPKAGVSTTASVASTRRADVVCKSVTIAPPARALSVVTLIAREEGRPHPRVGVRARVSLEGPASPERRLAEGGAR